MCFTVETDGSVTGVRVTNTKSWTMNGQPADSQAEQALKNAAIGTIKQWQYAPLSYDGQPVTTPDNCATIQFHLE